MSALVSEMVVEDKTASISGSYTAWADAMLQIKTGSLNNQVPGFSAIWRPQGVLSKSRPLKSRAAAKFFENGSPYEIFINEVSTEAV
ncbi:MAG: hypothetical protein WCK93_12050 [Nitrosomonadales bacterium]